MNAKTIFCTGILVLAIAFKLWLIAPMQITDDTDDSLHYMEQILLHKGPCFGPGTGMVGRLFHDLGIPFRIGSEVAFLGSSFLAIRALVDWPMKS